MGDSDSNQFMPLRNQLIVVVDNFGGDRKRFPTQTTTVSKEMEDKLTLVQEKNQVVGRRNDANFLILMQNKMNEPESSYAQFRLFARKNEEKKFQSFADVY